MMLPGALRKIMKMFLETRGKENGVFSCRNLATWLSTVMYKIEVVPN